MGQLFPHKESGAITGKSARRLRAAVGTEALLPGGESGSQPLAGTLFKVIPT